MNADGRRWGGWPRIDADAGGDVPPAVELATGKSVAVSVRVSGEAGWCLRSQGQDRVSGSGKGNRVREGLKCATKWSG